MPAEAAFAKHAKQFQNLAFFFFATKDILNRSKMRRY